MEICKKCKKKSEDELKDGLCHICWPLKYKKADYNYDEVEKIKPKSRTNQICRNCGKRNLVITKNYYDVDDPEQIIESECVCPLCKSWYSIKRIKKESVVTTLE